MFCSGGFIPPAFWLSMQTFTRKRNRLPPNTYRGPHSYFLTLCCYERRRFFVNPAFVGVLVDLFHATCASHSFQVRAYCFMPDHFHALLATDNLAAVLPNVVRAFKGAATTHARHFGISKLWQTRFYDHVIRASDSFEKVTAYIVANPVRAGLVNTPIQWPFSGPPTVIPETPRLDLAYVPPWKETTTR
jgi:putative transposase